ncbi:Rod shape-determining protein MreD [hydrothermal vent metagenome]|uniref:Rod shape-determining protein MreD n=1 Tax=hydrothermal vent metagenome TaxID=652676 RepID=A0A3B1A2C9_9ZZZZ
MGISQRQGGFVIFLSFIVAFMLSIIDLPTWAEEIRPQWVVLVLIYWAMALPQRISVGAGWVIGLLLDVTQSAILGQNALALAFVAFLTAHLHQRLRVFPFWQQAIVIFVFVIIYNLIVLWIKGISGSAPNVWLLITPSFTSAIFWPLVFIFLRRVRRIYRVN